MSRRGGIGSSDEATSWNKRREVPGVHLARSVLGEELARAPRRYRPVRGRFKIMRRRQLERPKRRTQALGHRSGAVWSRLILTDSSLLRHRLEERARRHLRSPAGAAPQQHFARRGRRHLGCGSTLFRLAQDRDQAAPRHVVGLEAAWH